MPRRLRRRRKLKKSHSELMGALLTQQKRERETLFLISITGLLLLIGIVLLVLALIFKNNHWDIFFQVFSIIVALLSLPIGFIKFGQDRRFWQHIFHRFTRMFRKVDD